ncbi:putative nurim [Lucilia cuprina]|uniref:Nuclear envelope membrane protein n=1 Tax=Lucilia cuprina TaxID=7375 RepID=A0A0L0C100_LUCCU|nr:Nurim like protein [Lucilia cuprina]KNC25937.1 putative nurim [Lucilia cuprina]
MASIKQYIVLLAAMSSFVYTLYVVTHLVHFLSAPRRTSKIYTWVFNLLDNKSRLETAYGPMVFNTLYLILFIFQHSFMKSSLVKKLLQNIGLASAERAIYSLTSSLCLHYLMKNWLTASSIILWQVDVDSNKWLWWSFVLLHALAWLIICGGSMIMDLPEIVGIKQAYYDMKSYAQPLAYKSFELRHLFNHIRHPSFVGFTVIFWATNLMTLDRLLLAILLTAYMYFAWSTDHSDLIYQKCQLQRKKEELKSQ